MLMTIHYSDYYFIAASDTWLVSENTLWYWGCCKWYIVSPCCPFIGGSDISNCVWPLWHETWNGVWTLIIYYILLLPVQPSAWRGVNLLYVSYCPALEPSTETLLLLGTHARWRTRAAPRCWRHGGRLRCWRGRPASERAESSEEKENVSYALYLSRNGGRLFLRLYFIAVLSSSLSFSISGGV